MSKTYRPWNPDQDWLWVAAVGIERVSGAGVARAGFSSEENVTAWEGETVEPNIATERFMHHRKSGDCAERHRSGSGMNPSVDRRNLRNLWIE